MKSKKSKDDTAVEKKYRKLYTLESAAVSDRCIRRDGLLVTTYEKVFDVILEAHKKVGHRRDPRMHKTVINNDLGYYVVPATAVSFFIDCCPFCVINKPKPKAAKEQPIQPVLPKGPGHRFQMDLIVMPECKGGRSLFSIWPCCTTEEEEQH